MKMKARFRYIERSGEEQGIPAMVVFSTDDIDSNNELHVGVSVDVRHDAWTAAGAPTTVQVEVTL